ncbi:MAG: helix-hairpin-helix domain-containing protein [Thiogranum sp.]
MLKHDFYAHPTVFDQLQNEAGGWFCARFGKLCPYAWTIGFGVLGLVFLSIAMVVFAVLLQQRFAGDTVTVLNQSLAQAVTMMIALLAAQVVFKQALDAWPRQIEMPLRLRFLAVFLGFRVPRKAVSAARRTARKAGPERRKTPVSEQQAIQEFFSGVRAAGVNVTIARTLFTAGVRSVDHLCAISDSRLYKIHGVGPATVRKLRKHFPAR